MWNAIAVALVSPTFKWKPPKNIVKIPAAYATDRLRELESFTPEAIPKTRSSRVSRWKVLTVYISRSKSGLLQNSSVITCMAHTNAQYQ